MPNYYSDFKSLTTPVPNTWAVFTYIGLDRKEAGLYFDRVHLWATAREWWYTQPGPKDGPGFQSKIESALDRTTVGLICHNYGQLCAAEGESGHVGYIVSGPNAKRDLENLLRSVEAEEYLGFVEASGVETL